MSNWITERAHRRTVSAGLVVAIALTGTALAMPPHPSLLGPQTGKRSGNTGLALAERQARAAGLNSPDEFFLTFLKKPQGSQLAPGASSFRILALLVDFSDHVASVPSTFFDSLIFDSVGQTVNDYFDEISYGQLDLITANKPSTIGWTRAPNTYDYYVNGQRGIGTYPQNSQGLVEDLVDLVDASIDFSVYDNDGDGFVDVLLVIHSGTGYEKSGDINDIHSHKWGLPSPALKDGVYISTYTIQPEFWLSPGDMTIGVYAHELCHGFGLPDLYDVDYTSNGIGDWGIMSFGSWNGPNDLGGSPAHPCAWSRIQMGLAGAVEIASSLANAAIAAVETGGCIYRLPVLDTVNGEYFLVENRQAVGYDTYLPSTGLLIWHIDSSKPDNTEEWWPGQPAASHYLVALEQADGQYALEQSTITGNTGDAGDPFPGTSNRTSFNAATTPNSDSYERGSTFTTVNDISVSGDTMYADLTTGLIAAADNPEPAMPMSVSLAQNYPNPFNPITAIKFSLDRQARLELDIYNLLGQKVKTLIDGYVGPGTTTVSWDATNGQGRPVASGVYLYRLSTEESVMSRKMVVLR